MAHFEQHCRDCEAILGSRHEEVNRWLDELFRKFGADHREHRHHWRGVWDAKGLWGEPGARAAVVHIVRDCGSVPTVRSYEKTNLGIIIAPAFLIAERQGKQDSPEAEAEFRQAVEKAFKKGRRDGVFLKACSSVGLERSPDKTEVGGSSPLTPTKFERSRTMLTEQVEVNGRLHDVCGGCGSVVGHGCPDSESCNCGEAESNYHGMNGVCCK